MWELNDGPTVNSVPSLLGPAPADLVLRVRGGPYDGQEFRIQGRKGTIGSSSHCTLRLDSPTIRPVHCLVLRGRLGTVVRRMAADCRLNGASFSDAALNTGDRLAVGPFELEVREEYQATHFEDRQAGTGCELAAQLAAREEQLATAERQLQTALNDNARLAEELAALRDELRRQPEREFGHEVVRDLRTELVILQSERDAQLADSVQRENEVAELRGQIQQFVLERDRADSQRRKLETALRQQSNKADQSQQLVEEIGILRERCHALQVELEQRDQTLHKPMPEVDSASEELARLRRQLDQVAGENARLQAEQQEWRTQSRRQENADDERLSELQAEVLRARQEAKEFAAERQAWHAERKRTTESQVAHGETANLPGFAAPPRVTATATVPNLTKVSPQITERWSAAHRTQPRPTEVGDDRESRPGRDEQSDEDAIEVYMERLLRRARGESEQDNAALLQAKKRRATSIWRVSEQPAEMADAELTEPAVPAVPAEPTSRKPPAEGTNIEALRDLANLSARSAIERHTRERYSRSLWFNLTWLVLTLGFDAFCWYLVAARGTQTSIACAVAALIPVALFFEKLRRALRLKRVYQTAARINCL